MNKLMNKELNFLFFALILFLVNFIYIKADTHTNETLDKSYKDYIWKKCTYSYKPYGEQSSDGEKITIEVGVSSNSSVIARPLKLYGQYLLPLPTTTDSCSLKRDVEFNDIYYFANYTNLSKGEDRESCPQIQIAEYEASILKNVANKCGIKVGSNGKTKIRYLFINSYNYEFNDPNHYKNYGPLTLLDEEGNVSVGGNKNDDRVIYDLGESAAKLFRDNTLSYAVNLKLFAYADGTYKIQVGSNLGTFDELSTATVGEKGIIWSHYSRSYGGRYIAIREQELEQIKKACPYPYKADSCKLKSYPLSRSWLGDIFKSPVFILALQAPADTEQVENNEEIAGVLRENFDVQDAILNGDWEFKFNMQISEKRGKCTDYLGLAGDANIGELADYLDIVFDIIKIGSIILTIVMCMLDFATVASKTNGNKDELMPMVKKWATRLIIVIVILLVPTFVEMIVDLVLDTENVLCGIK